MNVIINERFKDPNGKYRMRYYNLERKKAYTLKFGKWTKVIPMHCVEVKQRFDPIHVAALILAEVDYYNSQMKKYVGIINNPDCTSEDKNEYIRIMKTLHYLNNYKF
jgi:hypothetical protein